MQLDLQLALKARNDGIARVGVRNQEFIESARSVARMLCRQNGNTSMDQVREECERRGIVPDHFNAWGTVFHKSEFEPCGFIRSKQVQGHGNILRIWRLRHS